ncbi:C1A family cysteine protease [Desulfobaculum xiamenense]|uniref:C1A family cysteine protease n=1 Tax=Desulfobaculum xiamenense TaxID=995050 RepID=A0A846QWE6_9BACT|nr:C1 family peptidase [Desulfobaculum xiamenense]NJB69434.1 C1A family cysteine protease [Desulfobaculum xiamenense]
MTNDTKRFISSLQGLLALRNATWEAGETPVSLIPDKEWKQMLGCHPGEGEPSLQEAETLARTRYRQHREMYMRAEAGTSAYPTAFDWRNVNGRNFVTPVTNQKTCGSCVAFASTATLEANVRTHVDVACNDSGSAVLPVLSPAQMFFCNNCKCSQGWNNPSAMYYAKTTGVVPEACFPYSPKDQPCKLCGNWAQQVTKVGNYTGMNDPAAMKTWLSSRGPLLTCFSVYEDFRHYKRGVYRHTSGALQGGHAVCCVGYSDALAAWLCKNSWGSGWGESGYFWIGYGECGIDATMYRVDTFDTVHPLYNDLFVRDNLSDIGQIPDNGSACSSPDIIPWGPMPQANPQAFFAGNWRSDVSRDISAGEVNYIYVRGKNLSQGPASGRIFLHWSKASMLLWPSQWGNNKLKTSAKADSVPIAVSGQGQIVVGADPFEWSPDTISGDHYCLITRIETAPHPNPIPADGDIKDFASWLLGNPAVAMRNVKVVNMADKPDLNVPVLLEAPQDMDLYVALVASNLPKGSAVRFTCGDSRAEPLLTMPKTTISDSRSFLTGMPVRLPAGFSADVVVSFWRNGQQLDTPGSISVESFYLVDEDHPLAEHGFDTATFMALTTPLEGMPKQDSITPSRMIRVGQFTIIVQ